MSCSARPWMNFCASVAGCSAVTRSNNAAAAVCASSGESIDASMPPGAATPSRPRRTICAGARARRSPPGRSARARGRAGTGGRRSAASRLPAPRSARCAEEMSRPEHQRRDGRDEAHHELDDVLRVALPMSFGQQRVQGEAHERADEREGEDQRRDDDGVHCARGLHRLMSRREIAFRMLPPSGPASAQLHLEASRHARARHHRLVPPLHVRIFREVDLVPRMPPGPAEDREVGDRKFVGKVRTPGQSTIHDAVQPPRLLRVALERRSDGRPRSRGR